MNIEQIKTNFEELNQKITAAKREMRDKSKQYLEAVVLEFLDKYPIVEKVYWVQYTPYFNDGEACEFSVHGICFSIFGDEDANEYEGTYFYDIDDLDQAEKALQAAIEYETDPVAWRIKAAKEFNDRTGRTFRQPEALKPYLDNEAAARKFYEEVLESIQKFDIETTEAIKNDFSRLVSIINMIDEDIMKTIYGDHSYVLIDRSGTTIEHYDHD